MTFCPTGENFRSARCARGKKAHFCIFFHRNVTESIPSRRKYHKSGKKCRHLLQPNHPKLVSYVTYLLGPQISSHLSRHDMTCLSGAQISSHLSRFISDKSPPKIESFVERIVATKRPWARCRSLGWGGVGFWVKLRRRPRPLPPGRAQLAHHPLHTHTPLPP